MTAITALNDQRYAASKNHSDPRNNSTNAIPKTFNSLDLDITSVSAKTVLGYLLALVSGAVLLLTGQPPWFLLTAVVSLGVAFFISRVLDTSRSR